MMQNDMSLTMCEDRAAPLITEVFSSMVLAYIQLLSLCLILHTLELNTSSPLLSGLAKNPVGQSYQKYGRVVHADAIQQLEVTLVGSPAAQPLDVLAIRMMHPASTRQAIHHPQAYTATPMVPPPSIIPIAGITNSSMPVVASSSSKVPTPASQEIPPKHNQISPTPTSQPQVTSMPSSPPHPGPSDKSTTLPIVIVPELAIPPESRG